MKKWTNFLWFVYCFYLFLHRWAARCGWTTFVRISPSPSTAFSSMLSMSSKPTSPSTRSNTIWLRTDFAIGAVSQTTKTQRCWINSERLSKFLERCYRSESINRIHFFPATIWFRSTTLRILRTITTLIIVWTFFIRDPLSFLRSRKHWRILSFLRTPAQKTIALTESY